MPGKSEESGPESDSPLGRAEPGGDGSLFCGLPASPPHFSECDLPRAAVRPLADLQVTDTNRHRRFDRGTHLFQRAGGLIDAEKDDRVGVLVGGD